jgi:hypothetical protein
MRYKTKIEIITEAADKNEAVELVGEYLSGNIINGVDMRCTTKPANSHIVKVAVSVSAISLLILFSVVLFSGTRSPQALLPGITASDACQPPLKTSAVDKNSAKFKKQWEKEHMREALNAIKK